MLRDWFKRSNHQTEPNASIQWYETEDPVWSYDLPTTKSIIYWFIFYRTEADRARVLFWINERRCFCMLSWPSVMIYHFIIIVFHNCVSKKYFCILQTHYVYITIKNHKGKLSKYHHFFLSLWTLLTPRHITLL